MFAYIHELNIIEDTILLLCILPCFIFNNNFPVILIHSFGQNSCPVGGFLLRGDFQNLYI